LKITLIKSVEELSSHTDSLSELSQNASEPNIFYEPWMLSSAWENFGSKNNIVVVLISTDSNQAIGLFPLECKTDFHRLPIKHHTLWKYLHCFLCTPILRSGSESAATYEFFNWYRSWSERGTFLALRQLSGTGRFYQELQSTTKDLRLTLLETDSHERALLRSGQPGTAFLDQAVSAKKRKEYRRQQNRLSEQGQLKFENMSGSDSINEWLAQFLSLEQKGWKGLQGSALAENEANARFFKQIVVDAFNQGRLIMSRLTLNGQPIAMKCSFRALRGSFAFKIAYDETYAKYSPGVLMELENTRYVLDHTDLEWMDSCADPNHPMIDHIWRERQKITSLIAGTGSIASIGFVNMLSWLSKFRPRPGGSEQIEAS